MLDRLAHLSRSGNVARPTTGTSGSDDGGLFAQWNQNGFLVLDQLFSVRDCDAVLADLERYTGPQRRSLNSLITVDVLHGIHQGKCMRACEAPDEVVVHYWGSDSVDPELVINTSAGG